MKQFLINAAWVAYAFAGSAGSVAALVWVLDKYRKHNNTSAKRTEGDDV